MIGRSKIPLTLAGADGEAELFARMTWPLCMADTPRSSAAKDGFGGGNLEKTLVSMRKEDGWEGGVRTCGFALDGLALDGLAPRAASGRRGRWRWRGPV
jgi:hypothetical protein